MNRRTTIALFLAPLLFASCTTIPELGALSDRGDTRQRRIVVKLAEQKAYLYHRDKMVAVSPISSGREGKHTPLGRFSVIEKDADHRSSFYGNYVRSGMVVKENIDVRKAAGRQAASSRACRCPISCAHGGLRPACGNLPGYPASSGCVRLPKRQAKRFYDAVQIGTPVTVQR